MRSKLFHAIFLGRPVRLLAGVLCVTAATASCATKYQPRLSPRISVVMSGGMPAYSRDGQVFEHGFAGGGLVDAVAGDPGATEAAETYNNRMVGGLVSNLVAIACLVGGLSLTADRVSEGEGIDVLTGGSLLCALGGSIVAISLVMSAQPYQWDAINIYNDNVDARMLPYRGMPPGSPPAGVPGSPYFPPAGHVPPAAPARPDSTAPLGAAPPPATPSSASHPPADPQPAPVDPSDGKSPGPPPRSSEGE